MKVKGENVVLFIKIDDVWTPYACARSLSLTTSTELIETSVSGSGLNATYLPTKNTASGSAEGVVSFQEDGFLTLPDIRALQIAQTLILMKYERTDNGGSVSTDELSAYLTSVSDSGSFDGMAQFSFDFTVTGAITPSFDPFLRFRAVNQATGNPNAYLFYLEGTPAAGDEVTVHLIVSVTDHPFSYTVLLGDTIEDIIDALYASINPEILFSCTDLTTGLLTMGPGLTQSTCFVEITLT